jgi:UDP-N-acetylglucosamine acyltransferase
MTENFNVHPTAIIDDKASIASDVTVGPYTVIEGPVEIDSGTRIGAHVVISGATHIGPNCRIYPFAVIGTVPQDLKYAGEATRLEIGRDNVIREHVTMNPGTEHGGGLTRVGDNNLFMIAAHIAHDCRIGDQVVMANNATLAGHVTVGDHAIVGGLSAVHQFVRIGANAIIGGMSGVESDVIPYGRVKGDRAHLAGLNLVGLERFGFSRHEMRKLQKAYHMLFDESQTFEVRLNNVAEQFSDNETVMAIVQFAREKSRFPLCKPLSSHNS